MEALFQAAFCPIEPFIFMQRDCARGGPQYAKQSRQKGDCCLLYFILSSDPSVVAPVLADPRADLGRGLWDLLFALCEDRLQLYRAENDNVRTVEGAGRREICGDHQRQAFCCPLFLQAEFVFCRR